MTRKQLIARKRNKMLAGHAAAALKNLLLLKFFLTVCEISCVWNILMYGGGRRTNERYFVTSSKWLCLSARFHCYSSLDHSEKCNPTHKQTHTHRRCTRIMNENNMNNMTMSHNNQRKQHWRVFSSMLRPELKVWLFCIQLKQIHI